MRRRKRKEQMNKPEGVWLLLPHLQTGKGDSVFSGGTPLGSGTSTSGAAVKTVWRSKAPQSNVNWDLHSTTHYFGLDSKIRSEGTSVKGTGSRPLRNSQCQQGQNDLVPWHLVFISLFYWSTQSIVPHLSGDSDHYSKYYLPHSDALATPATDMALELSRFVPGPSLPTAQVLGCHTCSSTWLHPRFPPDPSFYHQVTSNLLHLIFCQQWSHVRRVSKLE